MGLLRAGNFSSALHSFLEGALVTWECLQQDEIVDETILMPALEKQIVRLSTIEDTQLRSKAEEMTRRALGNLLCHAARYHSIDWLKWILDVADVAKFKDLYCGRLKKRHTRR